MIGMKKSNLFVLGLVGLSFAVTGCSTAKRYIGVKRHSPDEYAVIEHAPLEMPKTYELVAPTPGAARPQEVDVEQQAQKDLFAETLGTKEQISAAEGAFLKQANAVSVDPKIRQMVDQETAEIEKSQDHLLDRILPFAPAKPGVVVDAEAEAVRIKQNQEEGKALNDGSSEPIYPKKKAPLEGFFK